MDRRLSEGLLDKRNVYLFGLIGFDDGADFLKIMEIIDGIINPYQSDWCGMEDMHGFFVKDGLRVEVEYNSMMGNFLVFKGDRTETNLKKVRKWAQIIFDNLVSEAEK